MKVSSLSVEEARDLLSHYKSEIKKHEFLIKKANNAISDIGKHLKKLSKKPKTSDEQTTESLLKATKPALQENPGRGRPAKIEISEGVAIVTPVPSTRKRTVKKKTGGYRLSVWDKFILEILEKADRPLVNSEFNALSITYAESNNIPDDEEQIRGKITRSIHKLANKRKAIKKHNISGKGYAYGLAEWFNSAGNLKKSFKQRLATR